MPTPPYNYYDNIYALHGFLSFIIDSHFFSFVVKSYHKLYFFIFRYKVARDIFNLYAAAETLPPC